MEKQNKAKFSKEKKLKITAALLVALSGILAGIVELFSNCGCCCTICAPWKATGSSTERYLRKCRRASNIR